MGAVVLTTPVPFSVRKSLGENDVASIKLKTLFSTYGRKGSMASWVKGQRGDLCKNPMAGDNP
jgi:hypothetical protein